MTKNEKTKKVELYEEIISLSKHKFNSETLNFFNKDVGIIFLIGENGIDLLSIIEELIKQIKNIPERKYECIVKRNSDNALRKAPDIITYPIDGDLKDSIILVQQLHRIIFPININSSYKLFNINKKENIYDVAEKIENSKEMYNRFYVKGTKISKLIFKINKKEIIALKIDLIIDEDLIVRNGPHYD